jgi:rSAM/selenodomain-associated transferase 1
MTAVLVLAKEPAPGRAKTRLSPACSPEEASALAEASLSDTLRTVAAARVRRRVLILAGDKGPWLPSGFEVFPQRGACLGERLAAAFEDVGGPAVLIGMDTPQVTPALLEWAAAALHRFEAVLGPAEDGGFWIVGMRRPERSAFAGIPMSRRSTGLLQTERLRELGLETGMLPVLRDVDTAEDARAVAGLAPETAFARRVRSILPRPIGAFR